ncbi:MAG: hypothetical protein Q4Q32_02940 [Methanobrevibacter sp.]|nr:hypothetical protein [Methanobrevibacter sp.]
MNKFKISLITVMLLLLSISAVSAVGITDYNAPIGFERNPVTFTHGDFEMDLKPYSTFIDYDDYFKTNDDRNVTIINETYAEYTDSFKEKSGALEIIKIDGDEYLIDCSYDELDKSKTKACLKYLKEFNDVNKFKPIKIEAES